MSGGVYFIKLQIKWLDATASLVSVEIRNCKFILKNNRAVYLISGLSRFSLYQQPFSVSASFVTF